MTSVDLYDPHKSMIVWKARNTWLNSPPEKRISDLAFLIHKERGRNDEKANWYEAEYYMNVLLPAEVKWCINCCEFCFYSKPCCRCQTNFICSMCKIHNVDICKPCLNEPGIVHQGYTEKCSECSEYFFISKKGQCNNCKSFMCMACANKYITPKKLYCKHCCEKQCPECSESYYEGYEGNTTTKCNGCTSLMCSKCIDKYIDPSEVYCKKCLLEDPVRFESLKIHYEMVPGGTGFLKSIQNFLNLSKNYK